MNILRMTLISTFIAVFWVLALHAQNNDAPAPLSTWNGKTFSIDTNKYRFAINFNDTTLFADTWRYMALGWQWNYAMPRIINKRLSVNVQPGSVDGNREGSFNAAPTNRTLYWNFQPTTIYHRFYAQALEWHPAVEPRQVFNFIPTPGDTGGAVFGFRSRPYGRVVTTKGSPHFMNIVLEDSTPNQPKRILAFSKPYYSARDRVGLIRDQSIGTDWAGWTNRDSTLNLENRTGKKWYFTVHLKRSDATYPTNDTTPVMSFVIRYYKYPITQLIDSAGIIVERKEVKSAYIKFDSVSALPSEVRLVQGRGYMDRKLQAVPAGGDSTVFVIRRNMLRPFNNNPDSAYVTLSAYFNTFEHIPGTTNSTNPSFPLLNGYDFKLDQSVIDSLDIQAWYYGKCNVALDWVRLETPFARTLFRGERDSLLAMQLSRDLDIMRQDMQRHSTKRVRIASFYGIDEVEALPYYIRFHRYLSSLYDRRLITEAGSSQAYMHMVPQRAYWTGGNFNANHDDFLFTPFKPESQTGDAGTDNPRNIERLWANRAGGWAGTYGRQEAHNFECVGCTEYGYGFPAGVAKKPPVQPSPEIHSQNAHRSLCYSEQTYFYVGERSTNMLYGKAPWYDYVNAHMKFRSGVWRAPSRTDPSAYDTLPYVSGSNPYWPEQLRSQLWWNLILGCKGFLCDGFSTGSDSTFQEWKQKLKSDSLRFDRNTGKASRNWINIGSMLAMPADFRSKINGQFDTIGTQTLLDPDIGPDYYTEKTDSIRSVRAFPDTSRQVLLSSFLAARYYGQTRYVDTIYKLSYMKTEIERDTKPFLFMGMRSVRNEVLKFFDYVSTHEAELLNLELLSYTGKGFHFTRSARADSTEYYSKFIDMRWGAVRTQGINEAVAEPWDTVNTFVDMSVLRRTDVAMDSMFYVGVVNRRTNPLVIARLANGSVDTAGKRYWEQHRYIPGIEFDSILATPNSPYKKYEQYGARIISVPFTYRRPNGSAVLLRIQTLDNTLDTVIGSSTRLTLPYGPGEGRLFRVTVLPAISDGANGSLQNSNQRKLVAYPYMRRVGNRLETTDSMVYHLCYHRTDSLGQSHVYYRRSVPQRPARVGADGFAAGLRWEQECDVSGALQIQLLDGDTASRNCAFPTLVVRMDETTTPPMPRVYVVFACEESESSNRYSIVENVFGAQESARNSRPRELARSTGRRMKQGRYMDREEFLGTWGAPAVNASAGGNYYAFADSLRGICTRFKSPAQALFSPYDTNSVRFATNRLSECVHPNLNTYSRISAGESSCALVWAEDTMLSSEQTHHIYYTHLQSSIGGSSHYLPRFVSDRTSCRVNNDSSIAQISDVAAGFDHQFPVVYRGVEKYNFNLKVPRIQWWLPRDRISWQSSSQPSRLNQTQSWWITSRGVDVSFPGGYFCAVFPVQRWYSSQQGATLYGPSLAQGLWYNGTGGDSAYMLNFTYGTLGAGASTSIVSAPQHYYSSIGETIDSPLSSSWINGRDPRLAALPETVSERDWIHGRRVYNNGFETSNTIVSSAEYLMKSGVDEDVHKPLTYVGYGNSADAVLCSQWFNDTRRLAFTPPYRFQGDTGKVHYCDTISTEWFRIGANMQLRSLISGTTPNCLAAYLQERSSANVFIPLPLHGTLPTGQGVNGFEFLHGGNREYRIILVDTCSRENTAYREEVDVDGRYAMDQAMSADSTHDARIDLGADDDPQSAVRAEPNPASDVVTFTFAGWAKDAPGTLYDLNVYTQAGIPVYSCSIRGGESRSLATQTLPVGAYQVYVTGNYTVACSSFVVLR